MSPVVHPNRIEGSRVVDGVRVKFTATFIAVLGEYEINTVDHHGALGRVYAKEHDLWIELGLAVTHAVAASRREPAATPPIVQRTRLAHG